METQGMMNYAKHMTQSLLCCLVEPGYKYASKTILLQIVCYCVHVNACRKTHGKCQGCRKRH